MTAFTFLRLVFPFLCVFWFGRLVSGLTIEDVTVAKWDGYVAYFAVPRERVAEKLAELKGSTSCDAEKLTLPKDPVLQDVIQSDQHVVAVAFGHIEATSVADALPQSLRDKYATEADTVQFYIPFLTGEDPTVKPVHKLVITSFVSTDKPFIQPNVAFKTETVEDISISSTGLHVRDGTEILSMSLPAIRICTFPSDVTEEEFEDYNREFGLSFLTENNLPVCNEAGSADLDICSASTLICPCQYWRHDRLAECDIGAAMELENITAKFQQVSLLTGQEGPAVLSFANSGNFMVGIKTPCI